MEQNNFKDIDAIADVSSSRKKKVFGLRSVAAGLLSLFAVVGIFFFAGPVVDSRPDKSDLAYGLMVKERQDDGNPELDYAAAGRYIAKIASPTRITPLDITFVVID